MIFRSISAIFVKFRVPAFENASGWAGLAGLWWLRRVLILYVREIILLNSSHASSRDPKHASERDFRGGGLARGQDTQIFIFIEFSFYITCNDTAI